MKKSVLFLAFLPVILFSQESKLNVEVYPDSILFGNTIQVFVEVNNVQGQFSSPEFEGFDIISGPNYSSSISIINGNSTSTTTYSYFLRPQREGVLYIDPFTVEGSDQVLESDPLEIFVHPNPDGVIQETPSNYTLPDPWFNSPKLDRDTDKRKSSKKKKRGIRI